jgi:hypothetical protein
MFFECSLMFFHRLLSAWHRFDPRKRVARHGWTAIYVGDFRTAPTWVYTVGFHGTLGQPEVVVFDLPQDAANTLLWQVFEEVRDGDLTLEDGAAWSSAATPCVWRKVHEGRFGEWLTLAWGAALGSDRFRGFEAYQLVLSDAEGKLPWEAGYDERLRPLQVALWDPPEAASA